jgi:ABC-type glutathione transport system ATPase component
MSASNALLELCDVTLSFGRGLTSTRVLDGVSIVVERGHTVGLVGESGSGKSTIAKAIVGIHRVESGIILFDGRELTASSRRQRREVLRRIQLIPQDPYSSLDPLRTIGQTLAEARDPKRASVKTQRAAIVEALAAVALGEDTLDRYPHEFSGGQRQRIAIARALMVQPDVIIADEITSALDVSTQAEILKLLARLKAELNLTVVFISHNLAVVREICDEVVVLLHGQVMEHGPVADVFASPQSEYTRTLIDSVPGGASFSLKWE